MKKRKGFVSNSSSSSFIIILPRKPKSKEDTQEILFHGKEGGLSVYEMDGLSFSQISDIVYNDIKDIKPATEEELIELLAQRYHYSPASEHCTVMGIRRDDLGGQWYNPSAEFWGTDKELLYKLRDFVINEEKNAQIRREKKFRIDKDFTSKHPRPKYAYNKGTNPNTGKPYTEAEYNAYDKWEKSLDEHRKNSKEYQTLEAEEKASWKPKYSTEDSLSRKLAKKDVKALLKTHNDKVIYLLNYGDNDGNAGCIMEHGNVFKNINHIRISQH